MYAVVGCTDCGALWLLSDPETAETARCRRCGKTHKTRKLNRFYQSEDRSAAREARAALLAKNHGDSAAFAEVPHVADLEAQLGAAGIDDETYLAGVGLDPDRVAAAGDVGSSGSTSRIEVVREAVREAGDGEGPTAEDVVAYATAREVPADAARRLLETLRRRGEVSETGGRYRLL